MGHIQGEGRNQASLFPVVLDDFVPADHICRVIDAFVEKLVMSELGFERAQAAETGRPGYDPRDLLKLYLYGYLNQIRSSRRLEAECRRNVELMWLLGRLYPDHKSIAEFRRMHRDAVTAAGAELVRFAKGCERFLFRFGLRLRNIRSVLWRVWAAPVDRIPLGRRHRGSRRRLRARDTLRRLKLLQRDG
jgi:transposase